MTYPSSFFLFPHCMCFKCVFAEVHWPLHAGGELLNCSPLHRSQFSLASAVNRRSLGLLELNHNYLPSSDGGESVHCVIPISPLDMKNAPRIQKGNIMSASWIWLARQNLRRGYSRPWVALTLLFLSTLYLCHPSLPSSLPLCFYPYISLSFLPVFVSLHPSIHLSIYPASLSPSISLLSAALSEYNCSYCASASKKSSARG